MNGSVSAYQTQLVSWIKEADAGKHCMIQLSPNDFAITFPNRLRKLLMLKRSNGATAKLIRITLQRQAIYRWQQAATFRRTKPLCP